MAEKEGLYDCVLNAHGEVLLCLRARAGRPENPLLMWDGMKKAVLHRDSKRMILLEYLPPKTRKALLSQKKVLIAEIGGDRLEYEYYAPISRVRVLPT